MTYKVKIKPGGHEFEIEQGETILDAAMRQSIDLPYGCRSGACGSCVGYILKGDIEYESEPIAITDAMVEEKKVLFCSALALSDLVIGTVEIEGLEGVEIKNLRCRVDEKLQLCHDVIQLKIKLADDQRLQFRAGQYIEFILDDGKRRAFSIANAPHDDEHIELHIRHVDGGVFTDFLFEEMPDKAMLRIEGPLGTFFLREQSTRPILLVGGGTGFGPLKGMVEHALHVGINQPIHVFMGVRARRDLYMEKAVKDWEKQGVKFTAVLSEPKAEDDWQGESGFVHDVVAKTYSDMSGFDIYISGPPPMVHAAADLFSQQGALTEHMFSDAFEYSADALKGIEAKK